MLAKWRMPWAQGMRQRLAVLAGSIPAGSGNAAGGDPLVQRICHQIKFIGMASHQCFLAKEEQLFSLKGYPFTLSY